MIFLSFAAYSQPVNHGSLLEVGGVLWSKECRRLRRGCATLQTALVQQVWAQQPCSADNGVSSQQNEVDVLQNYVKS